MGHFVGYSNGANPKLCLGIGHNYGAAWSMAWCPSGCWEDPNSVSCNDWFSLCDKAWKLHVFYCLVILRYRLKIVCQDWDYLPWLVQMDL